MFVVIFVAGVLVLLVGMSISTNETQTPHDEPVDDEVVDDEAVDDEAQADVEQETEEKQVEERLDIIGEKLIPKISGGDCFEPGEPIMLSSTKSIGQIFDRNWVVYDEFGKIEHQFREEIFASFFLYDIGKYRVELTVNDKEKKSYQTENEIRIGYNCPR